MLPMLERRRFPRTKVFKGAKVILANRSTINCVVRNLGNHGACLHLASTANLPAEFDLSFDTGLTLRKCRIAWQTLTNVGVSFEQPAGR
jgi:PilZ domain-containing protein